jgi:hypothetical protein
MPRILINLTTKMGERAIRSRAEQGGISPRSLTRFSPKNSAQRIDVTRKIPFFIFLLVA